MPKHLKFVLMKKLLFILFSCCSFLAYAQELYVSTEPASNMPSGSIGLRLNSKLFKMNHDGKYNGYRIEPEIMFGLNKNTMIHIAGYASDMFQKNLKIEGASIYGKYRFFSQDEVHEHLRLAAFAKFAISNNPLLREINKPQYFPDGTGGFITHDVLSYYQSNDIDLDGSNSGLSTGVVATKLKDKLAVSASLGYAYRMNNIDHKIPAYQPLHAFNYTASAGLLLLPREYTDYKQTNVNLYVELLGSSFIDKKQYYTDIAPAVQFIFNSIARLDLSYRTQLAGNTKRLSNNYFMVRLEYNLLNVF